MYLSLTTKAKNMGRLTEYFAYISKKETPTSREIQFEYTNLTVTQELRDARYKYRLELNKRTKAKHK